MRIFLIALIVYISLSAVVGIVIAVICSKISKKYKNFVLENSPSLKKLNEINGGYSFYPYENLDLQHAYDNDHYYGLISCKDYLIYQLQYIKPQVIVRINQLRYNSKQYKNYLRETEKAARFGQFTAPIKKLNYNRLLRIEQTMFENKILPAPETRFGIAVRLYCSKINGVIYDSKQDRFSESEVMALIRRLDNKRGNFFNDRGIWDAICRVERGKVSNKMRFAIFERDGYRCCKCGAYGRFAYLEIDHIIPISKGGKSTWDNLQTLCHDCNVEKGNKIENYNFPPSYR